MHNKLQFGFKGKTSSLSVMEQYTPQTTINKIDEIKRTI